MENVTLRFELALGTVDCREVSVDTADLVPEIGALNTARSGWTVKLRDALTVIELESSCAKASPAEMTNK